MSIAPLRKNFSENWIKKNFSFTKIHLKNRQRKGGHFVQEGGGGGGGGGRKSWVNVILHTGNGDCVRKIGTDWHCMSIENETFTLRCWSVSHWPLIQQIRTLYGTSQCLSTGCTLWCQFLFVVYYMDFCIFTRGQFWPSGIVVACVCVCTCVCVSVCPSIMSLSER